MMRASAAVEPAVGPTEDRAGALNAQAVPSVAPRGEAAGAAPQAAATPTPVEEADKHPWDPAQVGKTDDYAVVTVFYGTDRGEVDLAELNGRHYLRWFYATAVCAAVAMTAGVWALRRGQSRLPLWFTVGGTIATVALGIATTVVRVRTNTAEAEETVRYGNERGEFRLGTCRVSVPKYHEVGRVESPSIFRFEFKQDPRKHVVLLDVAEESADRFHVALRERVAASEQKEAFVFVHGYNVTFDAAAQRTAQLAYDLKFQGAPIFFSWPSQGGLLKYAVDETNVAWAVPHLKQFITEVAERSGAKSVHLIAHSMGNRALTSALQSVAQDMRKRRNKTPLFREVILTAPDIDADVFKRDIAPEIVRTARRVTLYASSNDEALVLSKKLHGYPRAGDTGTHLVVVPGVDTIDVSEVDTSLIGHSYYGSNDTVLADIFYLLRESLPPEQRDWLAPRDLADLRYWVFTPERRPYREAAAPEGTSR